MIGLMTLSLALALVFFLMAKMLVHVEPAGMPESARDPRLMQLMMGCIVLYWFFFICFLITAVWYAAQQGVSA